MRNFSKYSILVLLELAVIALLGMVAWGRLAHLRQPVSFPAPEHAQEQAQYEQATGTMLFVGDIMLDRDIRKIIESEQDPLYPFLLIASTTRAADLAVANLEGPISDGGTRQGSIYSFRFEPVGAINALQYAGFDVVNLANNHIWDYGWQAALDTMEYLRGVGISYIGFGRNFSEANAPVIKKVGDARVAFLGFTEFYGESARATDTSIGLSALREKDMIRAITDARNTADVVVVSMHWGTEYETHSNATQQAIAHALVDAGADLIIGHHPHVAQEVEFYSPFPKGSTPAGGRDLDSKSLTARLDPARQASGPLPLGKGEGYIAYSLGNFVFDQNFSADTKKGLMVEVSIVDKKITGLKQLPLLFTKTYQPYTF